MEQGFTGFNMDEKYEDAQIDNEGFLDYTKERKKQRFTKEEQLYGVFYDDFKEENDLSAKALEKEIQQSIMNSQNKGALSGFRKSGKVQHDPRKVVTVKFTKKDDENKDEEENEENDNFDIQEDAKLNPEKYKKTRKYSHDSSEDEEETVKLSKEQKRLKREFDFKNTLGQNKSKLNRFGYKPENVESIYEEFQDKQEMFYLNLPTELGQTKKQIMKAQQKEKQKIQKQEQKLTKSEQDKKDVYGKGFDILKKFGFQDGKGLGKNEDGLAKPVEANFKSSFSVRDTSQNSVRYGDKNKDGKKYTKKIKKRQTDVFGETLDDNASDYDIEERHIQQELEQEQEETYELEVKKKWEKNPDSKMNKKKKNKIINKEDAFKFLMEPNKNKKVKQDYNNFDTNTNVILNKVNLDKFQNQDKTDVINTQQNNNSNSMKIIDMTGKNGQQELNNYDQFFENKKQVEFEQGMKIFQKLQTKGQSVLQKAFLKSKNRHETLKQQIGILKGKIKHENDQNVTTNYEIQQLEQKDKSQKQDIQDITALLEELKIIQETPQFDDTNVVLDIHSKMFKNQQFQYVNFELEKLFVKNYAEAFKNSMQTKIDFKILQNKEFKNFQKLQSLLFSIYIFKENKNLKTYQEYLHDSSIHLKSHTDLDDPKPLKHGLDYIVQKGLLNSLRTYINNNYDPTLNFELLDFFLTWKNLLSQDLVVDLFTNLILPKLNEKIKETLHSIQTLDIKKSPHLWLIPWVELLSVELVDELCNNVLTRLSLLLQKFDISQIEDPQILIKFIKPWNSVLYTIQQPQTFTQFIKRSLMPKLMFSLSQIEINPQDQDINDLKIVRKIAKFSEILTEEQIVILFEESIVMKIGIIVKQWVAQEQYDKNDIKDWLEKWQQLIGSEITQNQVIKTYFQAYYRKAGIPIN